MTRSPRPCRQRRAAALAFAALVAASAARAETIAIDVQPKYGVTRAGLKRALDDARQALTRSPDAEVVVRIPAGTFTIADAQARSAIDVSAMTPDDRGQLVITGAGMDRTHLVIAPNLVGVFGHDVRHVAVQDLEFSRPSRSVTQGRVTAVGAGSVTVEVDAGFAAPTDLVDPTPIGHYLRRCAAESLSFPAAHNEQQAWTTVAPAGAGRWRFTLRNAAAAVPWQVGDTLAVKSKHGGNAYWFRDGHDVTFQRVRWLDESRGVFRGGMSHVRILDNRIERVANAAGRKPCLSTPDGGPQIGQPDDPPTTDVLVQGNVFEGTGDDAIALFNATGVVAGNQVSDSFARGILLFRSPGVALRDNAVARSPILRVDR